MSVRVRSEPRPARSRPRWKSPSSPTSQRPASLRSNPCGPYRSRKLPMFFEPPIGTTATSLGQGFERELVADPLDQHDRAREDGLRRVWPAEVGVDPCPLVVRHLP